MYSGNIGLYYDLEKIMRVIIRFRNRDDIVFAFAGGGALLDKLEAYKKRNHMDNCPVYTVSGKEESDIQS